VGVEPELGGRLSRPHGAHDGLSHRFAQRHRGGDSSPARPAHQLLPFAQQREQRAVQRLDGLADAGELCVLVVHDDSGSPHPAVGERAAKPDGRGAPVRAPSAKRPRMENTRTLAQVDPEIAALVRKETERQEEGWSSFASRTSSAPRLLEAVVGASTNKYAEGYPGSATTAAASSWTSGDAWPSTAAKKLFGAEAANVQRTPAARPTWPRTCR
jgi:hypothetical protein